MSHHRNDNNDIVAFALYFVAAMLLLYVVLLIASGIRDTVFVANHPPESFPSVVELEERVRAQPSVHGKLSELQQFYCEEWNPVFDDVAVTYESLESDYLSDKAYELWEQSWQPEVTGYPDSLLGNAAEVCGWRQ